MSSNADSYSIELQKRYDKLVGQQKGYDKELEILYSNKHLLDQKVDSLESIVPDVIKLLSDADHLSGLISHSSNQAENVSRNIRTLDIVKSRVSSCLERVNDILDLKNCTDGVQTALTNEDYEVAAGHIHRFKSLDQDLLNMGSSVKATTFEKDDADKTVTVGTLETSFNLLYEAESKLKSIVQSKFDSAVHSGDVASVERFFKIFPLLGLHEEGLRKYSKYLCATICDNADKSYLLIKKGSDEKREPVLFADALTALTEDIARIVEIHQPLIETYYGPGRILTFFTYIQNECDRQARKILRDFNVTRKIEEKVTAIAKVTSALPQSGSMSILSLKTSDDYQSTLSSLASNLDPKEIDLLLNEITLLNAHVELYLRFAKRRISADNEVAFSGSEDKTERDVALTEMKQLIGNCEMSQQMQSIIGQYILLEEFYMKEMVLKAVELDSYDQDSLTSSMIDESFFIIQKSIRRSISSGSIDGICAMLNNVCTILENNLCDILHTRLKSGFPSTFDLNIMFSSWTGTSSHQQKISSKNRQLDAKDNSDKNITPQDQYVITLNNVESTISCIKQLKLNTETEIKRLFSHMDDHVRDKLESCLSGLTVSSSKFADILTYGLAQLHSSIVKPILKPELDSFSSLNLYLTEEELEMYESDDPWVQPFIVTLDKECLIGNISNLFFMIGSLKDKLSTSNYDTLILKLSSELANQIEQIVLKKKFNRLGGLQFDKDIRSLIAYLTSLTTWSVRDKFARLSQIGTIVNLESVDEILDYWNPTGSGSLTWRLTPSEVRQFLSRRKDFRTDDIKRLKL